MSADIKLDGNWLVFEGQWTRVRSWDLMLDAEDRRSDSSGWRRALVHNHEDGLTINYSSDYPAGVKIEGNTKCDSVEADVLSCQSLSSSESKTGRISIGPYRLAYSASGNVVLGDSGATDMMDVQGPGVQIKGKLRVWQDSKFDEPIRTPDVVIAPKRPHGNAGDDPRYDPYNLAEKLASLTQQVTELQKQLKELQLFCRS